MSASRSDGLDVSVVVPVRDGARTLSACLAALAKLDPPPGEIVLVDNGSTDGSPALLRAFSEASSGRATMVIEPRRGAAVARNRGIAVASRALVAFTDADCAPERGWLAALTAPFAEPGVGAVAGRVVGATGVGPAPPLVELFSALYTLQLPAERARHTAWTPWDGGYPTANLAVRRDLLSTVHGFDERIRIYGEDFDLCARLLEGGATIVYAPDARVVHHHRTTVRGMLRQAFGFGRSHAYLLRRHARGLWVTLPRARVAWPGSPLRAWIDLSSADKKALALGTLGVVHPALLVLLPLYLGWLAGAAGRRAALAGVPASAPAAVGLGALLVLKSLAMTAGRWAGSARYGALCL